MSFQRQTLETPHKSNILLSGAFAPNGSSATDAANIRGNWISSVAHTATGIYTVTMRTDFINLKLVSVLASLRMDTAALSVARPGAIDMAAGTIVIYTFTEGGGTLALADIAADSGSWVDIALTVQYSPVTDGSNAA